MKVISFRTYFTEVEFECRFPPSPLPLPPPPVFSQFSWDSSLNIVRAKLFNYDSFRNSFHSFNSFNYLIELVGGELKNF